MFGGWVISHFVLALPSKQYWVTAWQALDGRDVAQGLLKPFLFAHRHSR